jgi:hypothetical protein
MTEQERELDLALADAMQENAQLRAKVVDYEGLIRDLTDALRGQRTWVGLTDEEINTAASVQSWKPFARAIEAKLKEKNT